MGTYAFITSTFTHFYNPPGLYTCGLGDTGASWITARSGSAAFLVNNSGLGADGSIKEISGNYTIGRSFRTLDLSDMAAGGSINSVTIYGTAICNALEDDLPTTTFDKPSLVISTSSHNYPLIAEDFSGIGASIAEYADGENFECNIGADTMFALTTGPDNADTNPFPVGSYAHPEMTASYSTLVAGTATVSATVLSSTTARLKGTFASMGFGGIYVEYDGDAPTGLQTSYCEYKLHMDTWIAASETSAVAGQLLGTTLAWNVTGLNPDTLYDMRFICQSGIVSEVVSFRTLKYINYTVYPADPITRVTTLRHYANRMTGVYRLTAYLGGLSNLPEMPFSTSKSPAGTMPLFPTQSPVLAHYDDDGNFVGFY